MKIKKINSILFVFLTFVINLKPMELKETGCDVLQDPSLSYFFCSSRGINALLGAKNNESKIFCELIKSLEQLKKIEGCLVSCVSSSFQLNKIDLSKEDWFKGIEFAFVSKGEKSCPGCKKSGYLMSFFYDLSETRSLDFILCENRFNIQETFLKIRLLTLEEVIRILNLRKTKLSKLTNLSFKLPETDILKLGNLLPDEKRKYLRKYLYNTLPNIRIFLMGACKYNNSIINTLSKDICMIIIKFVIEEEVENYKNDSLLLEL